MAEEKKKRSIWVYILAGFGIVFILILGSCILGLGACAMAVDSAIKETSTLTAADAKADEALADAEPTNVRVIQSDYTANEVAADLKWKGKRVKVRGVIHDISKDFMDNVYVSFNVGEYVITPSAFFVESDLQAIAGLSKGQTIVFTGTVEGAFVGDVHFKNCRLVQ